jgi:hypothetical protein
MFVNSFLTTILSLRSYLANKLCIKLLFKTVIMRLVIFCQQKISSKYFFRINFLIISKQYLFNNDFEMNFVNFEANVSTFE